MDVNKAKRTAAAVKPAVIIVKVFLNVNTDAAEETCLTCLNIQQQERRPGRRETRLLYTISLL
jgi:hypothetical protein